MVTGPVRDTLSNLRKQVHPNCVVCGPDNDAGLRLEFDILEDGSVQTYFGCDGTHEGFPGMLHGGVISSLLDGAMTNCLFAHGHTGITGELKVRFRYPVATGRGSLVRAWIKESSPPFHLMKAELIQDQQVKARATGKFVEQAGSQLECKPKQQTTPCEVKMPIYEYECKKCGERFEELQKMNDAPLKSCPKCGGSVSRLLGTGAAIIMKGSRSAASGAPRCGQGTPCCGRDVVCNQPPCDK